MKKGEFSALKKARRRTVKDATSLLRKFKSDDPRDKSKDSIQSITSKLTTESNSAWFGSDLLYIIHVQKRNRKVASRQESPSTRDNPSSSSMHDRYLAMMRKKDSPQSISILRLVLKDDDVDIKNTFELSLLRAIDFGSDDNELLLSFDQADHNLYFSSQNERDETLWIIIQICKHVVRNDITVGYSVDVDALSYITTSNGTLARFPLLQKMVMLHSKELGDYFSKEETEAESLLDELNWGSSLHEHSNLQQTLSGQSDKLSVEIIDFLLQWEEMDLHMRSNGAGSALSSSGPGKGSLTNNGRVAGVSDTSEVLQALSQVDLELEAVDLWLGEQIGRLEEVQANLHMIEDESGALESSWQSLRSVQEVVTLLVERYSLDERHEDLLMHPEKVMGPIMKASTLNSVEISLAPLLEAMTSVRNALKMKFTDVADISGPQWKQLQAMTSISSQRAKLNDIVDSCCEAFADSALGLFEWLVKHKSLMEAGATVKQFIFSDITTENISGRSGKISFTTVPAWFTKIKSPQYNQLVNAKTVYETNLKPFLPLLSLFCELAPKNGPLLHEAYLKAITEGMYKPLFKALSKDLNALQISSKHVVLALSNINKYKQKEKAAPLPLAYAKVVSKDSAGNTSQGMSPWMAYRAALMTMIPLLELEEAFVENFLSLGGAQATSARVTAERHHTFMGNLFDHIVNKFEVAIQVRTPGPGDKAASNSTASSDGMSAIAMLAVLTEFETAYREAVVIQFAGHMAGNSPSPAPSALRTAASRQSTTATAAPRVARFSTSEAALAAEAHQAIPSARTDEEALGMYLDLYLARSMETTRGLLHTRVSEYMADQILWLKAQKADAKLAEVLPPFAAFPIFVAQAMEMTNGKSFEVVDELIVTTCKELLSWLNIVSVQNDKYADKIKVANLTYFLQMIPPMHLDYLDNYVASASQQLSDALHRYTDWMVQYEFPSLSALAVRLDGVGRKVNEEELSLYIRRKDVLNVVKELEMRTLESMVVTMYKRLLKHFKSEYDTEMRLVEKTWQRLRERVVSILSRLEEAASLSYQIKLEVGPRVLGGLFDKVAGLVTNSTDANNSNK